MHEDFESNVRLSVHDNEGILAKFQAGFDRAVREESVGGGLMGVTSVDMAAKARQQGADT